MPVHKAKRYFAQLVLGLEHIHSHGIVHNDLHSGNILFGIDGRLKIGDFGTAEQAITLNSKKKDCMINISEICILFLVVVALGNILCEMISGEDTQILDSETGNFPFELFGTEVDAKEYNLAADLIRNLALEDITPETLTRVKNHPFFRSNGYFDFFYEM